MSIRDYGNRIHRQAAIIYDRCFFRILSASSLRAIPLGVTRSLSRSLHLSPPLSVSPFVEQTISIRSERFLIRQHIGPGKARINRSSHFNPPRPISGLINFANNAARGASSAQMAYHESIYFSATETTPLRARDGRRILATVIIPLTYASRIWFPRPVTQLHRANHELLEGRAEFSDSRSFLSAFDGILSKSSFPSRIATPRDLDFTQTPRTVVAPVYTA